MLAVALAALLALVGPVGQSGQAGPGEPAARGKGGLTITRTSLESVLLDRFGYAETGREFLDVFLKARLLDALAAKRDIQVGDGDVTRRWQELEKRSKATGQQLADEIQRRNLTPEQFREFLRLALVQERLTRKALGIPA